MRLSYSPLCRIIANFTKGAFLWQTPHLSLTRKSSGWIGSMKTAWVPINGKNYMHIYCLWVAGSFKGKGIGKELLEYAIKDAKEKKTIRKDDDGDDSIF